MASITIEGIPGFEKNLTRLARLAFEDQTKKMYARAAWKIVQRAKALAPYDAKRKKGTHLRDAILVSPGPRHYTNVLVAVRYKRPGAPHAHLVEFGTARWSGHPFLRPAVSSTQAEVQTEIEVGFLQLMHDVLR
jgi:HK97 gp10 family phage protein